MNFSIQDFRWTRQPERFTATDDKVEIVINVGGYIGESTRSEIVYAQATGKPVRYLEEI